MAIFKRGDTKDGMGAPPAHRDNGESGMRILEQSAPEATQRIGRAEVDKAAAILTKYKDGKSNLETRIVEDEQWFKLQHWEAMRRNHKPKNTEEVRPEPTSAWLFNALMNKHADASDNYPEPNVLPRERGDETDAKTLSAILPVIIERNGFEDVYSDNWWEKLKHGTAAYGVFWDTLAENGLGDVSIRGIDLLNIFWEPGVADVQKSRNLFIVDLVDIDLLEEEYPEHKGKLGGNVIDVKKYIYDDYVDVSEKTVVVDRYYKTRAANGRTLVHMMKFCGSCLLFASENDPEYTERGFYDHGMYPVVFDTLFPEKGTPVGFGYVAITKDPQIYIDKLWQNVLENAMMATRPRFFATRNTGINKTQFLDWNEPIIDVEGNSIDEERLRQLVINPMGGVYTNVLQMKIDELKETAANRDFSNGGATSGVTAAAAIAALQEAGNKSSRDMIGAAYRSYTKINYLCIELIRQFYDEMRSFRITGDAAGSYEFVDYNNANIKDQLMPAAYPGEENDPNFLPKYRRPVFDITVKAQKRSPFSRMSQNELAKELYGLGFFNPNRAQEALGALELMEFEGKDGVMEQVQQGQTLLAICQQMSQQMQQMADIIQALTGQSMGPAVGAGESQTGQAPAVPATEVSGGGGIASGVKQAQTANMTGYGERLAARSTPSMNTFNGKATPSS